MSQLYEVVATCKSDDAKVERIMDRLIKPEFDSFAFSDGRFEWTWDFDTEAAAQDLLVILRRVDGVTAEVRFYPAETAIPEAMAA